MMARFTLIRFFTVIFLLGAFSLLNGCASDNVTQRTKLPYIDQDATPPTPPSPAVPPQPAPQGSGQKPN